MVPRIIMRGHLGVRSPLAPLNAPLAIATSIALTAPLLTATSALALTLVSSFAGIATVSAATAATTTAYVAFRVAHHAHVLIFEIG